MYIQLLCDRLGLEADQVRVIEGDTDRLAYGTGAGGSRSSAMGTAALVMAADKIVEKGRQIASVMLEAAVDDIEFEDGTYTIAGTDRNVSLADVVRNAFTGANLPEGMEPGMLAHAAYHGKEPSYPLSLIHI